MFLSGIHAAAPAALRVAFVTLLLALAPCAPAQITTPIRLVVPFAAGGPTDVAARIIAPKLGDAYKRPVIIDNKVGATGAIGAEFVAHAPPDGANEVAKSSGDG